MMGKSAWSKVISVVKCDQAVVFVAEALEDEGCSVVGRPLPWSSADSLGGGGIEAVAIVK